MDGLKIGIFSGTFDPIHIGHVEACVVALGALELDKIFVFVEKKPHRKQVVTDYKHRLKMTQLSFEDNKKVEVVDDGSKNVTVSSTLEYLKVYKLISKPWFIVGSDLLEHIPDWHAADSLFDHFNICVVLRDKQQSKTIEAKIDSLAEQHQKTEFRLLPAVWSPISSGKIKQELYLKQDSQALNPAVANYIKLKHLYK